MITTRGHPPFPPAMIMITDSMVFFTPSIIESVILFSKSSEHHKSQTVKARELRYRENGHPTSSVTCHRSCVMSYMSRVTWHMSSYFFYFFQWTNWWSWMVEGLLSHYDISYNNSPRVKVSRVQSSGGAMPRSSVMWGRCISVPTWGKTGLGEVGIYYKWTHLHKREVGQYCNELLATALHCTLTKIQFNRQPYLDFMHVGLL